MDEKRWNKKGQVTIFIIIAIIIVATGILIYSFYPQIKTTFGGGEKNPKGYIQTCIEQDIKDAVESISIHGGESNPEFSTIFNEEKIK